MDKNEDPRYVSINGPLIIYGDRDSGVYKFTSEEAQKALSELFNGIHKAVIALQQIAMAHPSSSEHDRAIYQITDNARFALLGVK